MTERKELSRRDFIKAVVAGAASAAAFSAGIYNFVSVPTAKAIPPAQGVVVPDPSLCIGCLTCEVICTRYHRKQGLSELPRIQILDYPDTVLDPEIVRNYPNRGTYSQRPCKMCPEPDCVVACPYEAMKIDEGNGARYIDESLCQACGRCMKACPYEIEGTLTRDRTEEVSLKRILYDPDKNVYVKCDLCRGREKGPICVERCPVNIRIRQGIVKSEVFCLDLKPSTEGQIVAIP